MNNDHDRAALMKVVGDISLRVTSLRREQANTLTAAANHHAHGDYTREVIAQYAAAVSVKMAEINRQLAGLLAGTWLPEPGEVKQSDGLGIQVGLIRWAPPSGASVAELHRWREFADELNQEALRQRNWVDDAIRAAQATQVTGRIKLEDLPQPDPLTASPSEATGAQAAPIESFGGQTAPDAASVPRTPDGRVVPPPGAAAPQPPESGLQDRSESAPTYPDGPAVPALIDAAHAQQNGADASRAGLPQRVPGVAMAPELRAQLERRTDGPDAPTEALPAVTDPDGSA